MGEAIIILLRWKPVGALPSEVPWVMAMETLSIHMIIITHPHRRRCREGIPYTYVGIKWCARLVDLAIGIVS